MATQPKPPAVYTELVDAEVIRRTPEATQFVFGERDDCWVPRSTSKVVNGKFYVMRWMALQKAKQWKGIFIKGTEFTRMRSMTHQENTVADAIPLIREVLRNTENILRALEIMPHDQTEEELDAAAAKLMQTLNKEPTDGQ